MTVSELYESGATACSPQTPLARASRLMVQEGIDLKSVQWAGE